MGALLDSILSAFGAAGSGSTSAANNNFGYGGGGGGGAPTTQAAIDNYQPGGNGPGARIFTSASPMPEPNGGISTTGNYNNGGAFQGGRVLSVGGGAGGAGGQRMALGGNGGGLGGGGLLGALQGQFDMRNKADAKRYKAMMALASKYGADQLANNDQQLKEENASSAQTLMTRGLGNSTIAAGVASSNGDRAKRRALDINQRTMEGQMGVMRDHQAIGPDMGLYASLLQQPGALGNFGMYQGQL
jgi:hypothetical protein